MRNHCRIFVYLLLILYLVSLHFLQFFVFADDGAAKLA